MSKKDTNRSKKSVSATTWLTKPIPKRKLLYGTIIAIIAVAIVAYLLIRQGIDNSVNMSEYRATQKRCGTEKVVVGFSESFQSTKLVYHSIDDRNNSGPVVGGVYFCTDAEAEAAGYVPAQL